MFLNFKIDTCIDSVDILFRLEDSRSSDYNVKIMIMGD